MKTFTAIANLAAVGIAAVTSVNAQATVQSPPVLIQCQPAAITWSGASGTVYLSVVLGSDVASPAFETFPEQTGASGSYAWSAVSVPAGQTVTFIVNDSTGTPNYSSQVTVNEGSSDSCLTSSGSGSSDSSSAAAGTSTAAGGASSSAAGGASTASSAATGTSTGSSSGAVGSSLNALAVVGAAFAGAAFLA